MIALTRRRVGRLGLTAAVTLLVLVATPGLALAHPLGNFTINHYAGLRVRPDAVLLDVVIDEAEIPAFQVVQTIDVDGDGEVSDAEAAAGRVQGCGTLVPDLRLTVGGAHVPLRLWAAGIDFPPGVAGVPTMRLVCEFDAVPAAAITSSTPISFADRSYPIRIGWREIVVQGDGTTIEGDSVARTSVSGRLTSYPKDLIATPLAVASVTLDAKPGGPVLPAFVAPEAVAVPGAPAPAAATRTAGASAAATPQPAGVTQPEALPAATSAPAAAAAVPGGVGSEVPAIFRRTDVDPGVALLALATAILLGAWHAVTPGHGKTLIAAYLVGTRGRPLHAVGLGLSVSLSHTLGILGLGLIVVGAQRAIAPDLVVRLAPIVAAVSIVAIGGSMLVAELRRIMLRRREQRQPGRAVAVAHPVAHEHSDEHDHEREHVHDHEHPHEHDHADATEGTDSAHSHGLVPHRHVPPPGGTITWRGLFAIGLAGGLIPSASALLILLVTVAAGRPLYGVILVAAFGLGMAAVMTGVGLALVFARDRLERLPRRTPLGRATAFVPLVAAVVVLGLGVVLTTQALVSPPTL